MNISASGIGENRNAASTVLFFSDSHKEDTEDPMILREISGYSARKCFNAPVRKKRMTVSVAPIESVFVFVMVLSRSFRSPIVSSLNALFACRRSSCPSGVSSNPFRERMNRLTPSSFSSFLIPWLTPDWVRWSASAARVAEPKVAAARNSR